MSDAAIVPKTCRNCLKYRQDAEEIRMPSGGDGWCLLRRAGDGKQPQRRTSATNWCDRHALKRTGS